MNIWIKKNLHYLLLLFGIIIIALVISNVFITRVNDILLTTGITVLGAGVFTGVIRAFQFRGFFREDMKKVILGDDFLRNRKDLATLQEKTTKLVYSDKFPDISERLNELILDSFSPSTTDYYYHYFQISIEIIEIKNRIIKYKQKIAFKVFPDATKKHIDYKFINSDNSETISYKINNIELAESNKGEISFKATEPFDVQYSSERQYSLVNQNYKLFKMTTFCLDMSVNIHFPKNVEVSVFELGNITFKKYHTENDDINFRTGGNGILPYQGFGLSFHQLNNE